MSSTIEKITKIILGLFPDYRPSIQDVSHRQIHIRALNNLKLKKKNGFMKMAEEEPTDSLKPGEIQSFLDNPNRIVKKLALVLISACF